MSFDPVPDPQPGIIYVMRNGRLVIEISSDVFSHPDMNPNADTYPEEDGNSYRARYERLQEPGFWTAYDATKREHISEDIPDAPREPEADKNDAAADADNDIP